MEGAHDKQTRWDGRPYSVHPIRVVEILRGLGHHNDKDLLCAAYLHDVVEDTKSTREDIVKEFGPKIAGIVEELTNNQDMTDEEYLLKCDSLSYNARIIKVADILANIGDKGKKSDHFLKKRTDALIILLRNIPV